MKKFFARIVQFLILGIVTVIILEFSSIISRNQVFDKDKLALFYKNDVNEYQWISTLEADSINILAGSSSVKYGLSCNILNEYGSSNSFFISIANDARDPIQSYYILKNSDLSKVSSIYYGLDPWIFAKRYYKHRASILNLDFSTLESLLYFQEHDKLVFLKRYKSLITHYLGINPSISRKHTVPPPELGSQTLLRAPTNFDISDWFQLNKYSWSDLQFKYLKKIELLCQEQGIAFFLFIPPKRSDYTAYYKTKCQTEHAEYLNKLAHEGINSPIFGHYNSLDTLGDSILFAEAYHLNKEGQQLYSELFYELSKSELTEFSASYDWFLNQDEIEK